MNEKWETEFFEWKDEIESKFNNISQKNTELENKFEFMESEFKCTPKSFSIWVKKCKENKEQIAKLNKLEVVLRDIMNVLRINDLMSTEYYNEEIKKLDSSQESPTDKTEKKDSETLKKIKNLAQEESDFYDKHGYFSFWSDKLKAQRIKDSKVEKKDIIFTDHLESGLLRDSGKKEACLLKKPHASAVSVERKLIEKCQCSIHKDSGKRNMEFYNKGYEVGCETGYKLGKNDSIKKFLKKELYELYLKDKGECYFKKITHPFTEYNNMVHRGIGMKLMPYDTEEKLIEGFIKVLKVFKCGCGDGFDLQIIEEYEGILNK